jgi:membrane-associated protein
LLFVVFAETGLFFGFFLPGDSLLFVAGLLCGTPIFDVHIITLLISVSIAGILGNFVGYYFGKKTGPVIFSRDDSFFFKKKHAIYARDFYEKHGGRAIVIARFIPIIRTFAPIVAGIVKMDKAKFTYFNVVGCLAWVASMLCAGHFLQSYILNQFQFDLKKHLEVIVIVIVFVTTAPVIFQVIKHRAQK